jgi:hypothetical protein
MSKNHLPDFKNLENHTSQHDALKIRYPTKTVRAYYFIAFISMDFFLLLV